MTNEEIDNLTLEQYNAIENQPVRKNAWSVAHEVSNRVDGAPCMGEHMKATTAIEPSEGLFWNKEYLEAFYKTQSLTVKQMIPEYFYIFDELHTQSSELYREFLKGDCKTKTGELCDWCKANSFRGPPCGRVPRPYPAYNEEDKPHYLDVFQTSVCNTSGQPRALDDFQPSLRANVKELVKEGKLSIKDDQSITSFSEKYIVAKEYVVNAVRHIYIYENTVSANLRKQEKANQTYIDILKLF